MRTGQLPTVDPTCNICVSSCSAENLKCPAERAGFAETLRFAGVLVVHRISARHVFVWDMESKAGELSKPQMAEGRKEEVACLPTMVMPPLKSG